MSGAITGAGARTPVDYAAIERRVKDELQSANDSQHPNIVDRAEAAETRYYDLMREGARAHNRSERWHDAGIVGIGAGVGLVLGAGLEGLASRNLGKAALTGALFAGAGAAVTGIGLVLHDMYESFGGTRDRSPLPDSAEIRTAEARYKELRLERESLPDPEHIEPGAAWMSAPSTAGWPNTTEQVRVGTWVEDVFARHDHDRDGELRIGDSSDTAGNELLRNAVGGAYSKDAFEDPKLIASARQLPMEELGRFDLDGDGQVTDAEIELALARPRTIDGLFGVTRAQLQRFDLDHSDTLSRAELAEGVVRDSVGEWHKSYSITNTDGTIPRTLEEMRTGWATHGGSFDL